jgi:hypothetical protein
LRLYRPNRNTHPSIAGWRGAACASRIARQNFLEGHAVLHRDAAASAFTFDIPTVIVSQ